MDRNKSAVAANEEEKAKDQQQPKRAPAPPTAAPSNINKQDLGSIIVVRMSMTVPRARVPIHPRIGGSAMDIEGQLVPVICLPHHSINQCQVDWLAMTVGIQADLVCLIRASM
uniref:Uncharacterized protein n=1 Tax=Oryza brachyantha TaxID=4533 RepID=J3LV51_ORYBR